ncbi:neurotrypsin-like [Littorina saxatilis]|uniref:SRCR domain-containing protein n=1 Tax=Littorina saxatilis TaxID=31220 RepID=A0AAN9FVU6_9CAEN
MAMLWCAILLTAASLRVSTGATVDLQDIRLANGNATAGRVEVLIDRMWGTVCDDSWADEDAGVVCRSLGLTGGVALSKAAYGKGQGPIHMDDVHCTGDENSLGKCWTNIGSDNCLHSEDAAVICQTA